MKNKDLFNLLQTLDGLIDIKGKAFAYCIYKNKEKIKDEIEVFKKLQKEPHPDFVNYDNERNLLCIMHAKKDEHQNPIIVSNPDGSQRYDIEDMGTFQSEYNELIDKYRYVIDEMETAQKEYNEFLERETNVVLNKIKVTDLPDDVSARFLEQVKDMIE